MKNEAAFWSDWLLPLLHQPVARRVAWKVPAETREGLPDVWFKTAGLSGWLELKYVPQWPVRARTPIYVKVTAEQLAHLREARIARAAGWVLLGVDTEWFLLRPHGLRPDIPLTHDELLTQAEAAGKRSVDDRLLLTALGAE
jgi:hypothetical protein